MCSTHRFVSVLQASSSQICLYTTQSLQESNESQIYSLLRNLFIVKASTIVSHYFNVLGAIYVQPNTRIIAICGITDFSGQLPKSPSSSETDAPSPEEKTGTLISRGKELFSPSKRKERKRKEILCLEENDGMCRVF